MKVLILQAHSESSIRLINPNWTFWVIGGVPVSWPELKIWVMRFRPVRKRGGWLTCARHGDWTIKIGKYNLGDTFIWIGLLMEIKAGKEQCDSTNTITNERLRQLANCRIKERIWELTGEALLFEFFGRVRAVWLAWMYTEGYVYQSSKVDYILCTSVNCNALLKIT